MNEKLSHHSCKSHLAEMRAVVECHRQFSKHVYLDEIDHHYCFIVVNVLAYCSFIYYLLVNYP